MTGRSTAHTVRRRPLKRLGQHFLAPSWARRIVTAVAARPNDVFLEIGPGTGALTLPLAETGAPILAVEVDPLLARDLADQVPGNVTVITGDILTTEVTAYLTGLQPQQPLDRVVSDAAVRRFRVVGNLPYYIASPILFRLLDLQRGTGLFSDASVMLQREVADRLLAAPGSRDYGVLTILLTRHARVTRLLDLPPGAFTPPPKVRSSVVQLTFVPPLVPVADEVLFERMVKTMFGQRRKTMANSLKGFHPEAAAIIATMGLDGRRRPETLDLSELAALADAFARTSRSAVL